MFISSEEKYGPHKKVYRNAWREGGWERKHEFDREIESVSSYNDMAVTYQSHDSISSWLKFFVDKKL